VVAREGDFATEELGPECSKGTGIGAIESDGSEMSDFHEQNATTLAPWRAIVHSCGAPAQRMGWGSNRDAMKLAV
jgi:hypothetical protein